MALKLLQSTGEENLVRRREVKLERATHAKLLKQERLWCVSGTKRRPVSLLENEIESGRR